VLRHLLTAGLLVIAVIVLTPSEAPAAVCLVSIGGKCTFWSNGTECDILADQFGSINKNPKVDCQIAAPGDGVLACANGGAKGKTAPGIQLIHVIESPESFGKSASIKKSDVANGIASIDVTAFLLGQNLTDLGTLYCPNANWFPVDYVPCDMSATITLQNDSGKLDEVTYQCTLPSCDTLQFDIDTHKFERRQFDCTLVP
jgi:hypothetical protein